MQQTLETDWETAAAHLLLQLNIPANLLRHHSVQDLFKIHTLYNLTCRCVSAKFLLSQSVLDLIEAVQQAAQRRAQHADVR